MSSEKVDNDDPNYAVVDIPDSKISTYAVIDKNMKSEDSTYDELNIRSKDQERYVSMKKEEVKKLSESLCDKKLLCLLVANIVIIVTICTCFLLAFIHISQLRSERATVQVS